MKAFTKKEQELKIAVCGDLNHHLFNEFSIDENNRDEMMAFFVQQLGLSEVRSDGGMTGPGIEKLSNNDKNIKVNFKWYGSEQRTWIYYFCKC